MTRSDTHDALYPLSPLRVCTCGARFQARPLVQGEDPGLCLACARPWSKLVRGTRKADVLPMRRTRKGVTG
jgi:hypothetical protein